MLESNANRNATTPREASISNNIDKGIALLLIMIVSLLSIVRRRLAQRREKTGHINYMNSSALIVLWLQPNTSN
jgi:hypothetical protein